MAKVPPSILDLRRRKQKPGFRGKGIKTMYTSERQAAYTFPSVLADAKFAYSTYDLYGSGRPVIRLRDTITHSGGDTERDFTAKELTDGTLTNWALSEDPDGIKVAKLYDQAFRKPVYDREVTVPNTPKIAHPEPVHLINENAEAQPSFRRDDLTIKFDTYQVYFSFPSFQTLYGAEPGGNSIERERRVRIALEVNGLNSVQPGGSSSGYKVGTAYITFQMSMKTAEVNAVDQVNFYHSSTYGANIVNPNHMRRDFAYSFGLYSDVIQGWGGIQFHPAASVYAPYGPVHSGAQDGFHFGNNFLPTTTQGGTNVLKLGLNRDDYPTYRPAIEYSSAEITTSLETYTFQQRSIPFSTYGPKMEGWKGKTQVLNEDVQGTTTYSGIRMRQIRLGDNHFRTSAFLLYGGDGPTSANSHIRNHNTGLTQEEVNQIDDHLESFYNY